MKCVQGAVKVKQIFLFTKEASVTMLDLWLLPLQA